MTASAKQKAVTGVITFVVIFGLHAFMFLASIPSKDFTKIYEKLDDKVWKQFLPKKITVEEVEPEKSEPVEVQQPEPKQVEQTELPATPVRRERFNPDKLNTRLKLGRITPTPNVTESQPKLEAQASPSVPSTRRAAFSQTQFKLLEGNAGALPTLPSKSGSSSSRSIEVGQGKALENSAPEFQGRGEAPEAPQKQSSQPSSPELALGDFDRNKIEVSEIFKALIEWVKRNPVELSPAMKQFLGYRDGGLTSKVQFKINRRNFDMFLLCFEGNYEVRIALVEKNEMIYLIDQGLTKESQK